MPKLKTKSSAKNRLNSDDIEKEKEISINQVREIAKLRLEVIINE